MPMIPNTGMPAYGNNFTNQTTGCMNTNMNTGGCTCHGNNTTFNQTNPQNNNQGLNNFFVPFPYGRE